MDKKHRIILFGLMILVLVIIFKTTTGTYIPADAQHVVIFSSLILMAFASLFLEHFYSKPSDVLASTVSILLLISPLSVQLSKLGIWYTIFWWYNFILMSMAFAALFLLTEDQSSNSIANRISLFLKQICVLFGNGRFLFFVLFILTMLSYVSTQSPLFLFLFGFSTVVLLIQPHKINFNRLIQKSKKRDDIGELFCVQAGNVFLAKIYGNASLIKKFDIVQFSSSISKQNKIQTGLIIDKYLLDQVQWIKILCDKQIEQNVSCLPYKEDKHKRNVIYQCKGSNESDFVKRLVGIVIEKSTINKIRFEFLGNTAVSEGDLLEIIINEVKVIYQIVQGITDSELLEAKNESGTIIGEAVQLGIWDSQRRVFEKFGWVPQINSPVLIVSEISPPTLEDGEKQIGTVPNTNYPVIMNISEAISHHIAILGVTGTGKSVFSRSFIKQIMGMNTKVICVDFTHEYKSKMSLNSIISHSPAKEGEPSQADVIFGNIDWIANELEKFGNQQDKTKLKNQRAAIFAEFQNAISTFMSSDSLIGLFELPDVSNTTGILEYTKWFFQTIFYMAKNKKLGQRLCIVIEEAHTVIPEWNFIGESNKQAGALVNAISQIALQGRKYGVGFIVIAQRTANVSKTVLTQCNSVIAFQQFDKTSIDFLSNYMGSSMAETLPNLKFRQAVAVGRGFRSGVPMIFEVPFINEESKLTKTVVEVVDGEK